MTGTTLIPEVLWAQRSSTTDAAKNVLYVTIKASDVPKEDLDFKLTSTSLHYKGKTTKGAIYAVDIDFYEEIDPEESRHSHSLKETSLVLRKKEKKEEFWPRLSKDKARLHWLKTDFDKWVDEDEQDGVADEPAGMDPSMMSQYGGGEDAGGFGGIDFSKLGGGAGMGGMPGGMDMEAMMKSMGGAGGMGGMGGMPGMGEGGDSDEDDDDMPGLEEEGKEAEVEGKGKGKEPTTEEPKTSAGGKIEEL